MIFLRLSLSRFIFPIIILSHLSMAQEIPLPEHPRPDFHRPLWQNLNGEWAFQFDSLDVGLTERWERVGGFADDEKEFSSTITVPFPWGSALSKQEDLADIGWYKRSIQVDESWKGKRIFLVIGASDWETTVWIGGQQVGQHRGGYVPFSVELTEHINFGESQRLVIRVDDKRRAFTLYGKQGYGNARGIWQTVYLEARGTKFVEAVHISPNIDKGVAKVKALLPEMAQDTLRFECSISTPEGDIQQEGIILPNKTEGHTTMSIPSPRLWTLDDPYLYEAKVILNDDTVNTYFGMRKVSVVNLPGTDYPYVALNDEPIYLQLTLDQSYHPEGYYTFPSDDFMKAEIARTKSIGLNGIRPHIKVEIPRKLYWADKLGLLVMADVPNSWGEPEPVQQAEWEYTMREMIKRDYNHASIFSWVMFNETWGLFTAEEKERTYLAETQDWVASMYYLAKSLDPTRLVEDNSICCGRGHTETDLNSFHYYLPGWGWQDRLQEIVDSTYSGSGYQFESGYSQGKQPLFNSECGNVWGYEGSTGDVDWSFDYHWMINVFRTFPKVGGWLYTEHHDVINEWNGYWRFDRTEKFTGLAELVPGMSLQDFHSDVYLSTGNEMGRTVEGGTELAVPLFLSVMSSEDFGSQLSLHSQLVFMDEAGNTTVTPLPSGSVDYQPWMQKELAEVAIQVPNQNGLGILQLYTLSAEGDTLHRNFYYMEVISEETFSGGSIISQPAAAFSAANWSKKQWEVLDGKKVNGAGKGYFEYQFSLENTKAKEAYLVLEAGAKELFVKDQEAYEGVDFMLGGRVAASSNPNAYPMTDETLFPSEIAVYINGEKADQLILPDDPADHRGILSWHHQLRDRKLREAGSYGYLVKVPVPEAQLEASLREGSLTLRIETVGEGGIAIYGKSFGRYPIDPSLVCKD
ncbi:MAG: sugar-binding domain-containing protein [Bacteroidota bacterium]